MYRLIACLTTEHDLRIVLLAMLVCLAGIVTALKIYAQALRRRNPPSTVRIVIAGASAACGIWATHFISMLAYLPGVPTRFDMGLTLLSLALAGAAAMAGFRLAARPGRSSVLAGGLVIGCGIAAMHYVGMRALIVAGRFVWQPDLLVLSIAAGLTFSTASMAALRGFGRWRGILPACLWLIAAVGGLHFIGMAAAVVQPDPSLLVGMVGLDRTSMAIALTGVTGAVLLLGVVAIFIEKLNSELAYRTLHLRNEISERVRAEDLIASKRQALIGHQSTLHMLLRNDVIRSGSQTDALRTLSKVVARTLTVDRVGFWLLGPGRDACTHGEVYASGSDTFVSPDCINDPGYAATMVRVSGSEIIAVTDTSIDKRLEALQHSVIGPARIISLMQAPIMAHGELVGFISCATTQRLYDWQEEHKLFVANIANLAALVIERHERARVEAGIADAAARLSVQQAILNRLMRDETFRQDDLSAALFALSGAATRAPNIDRCSIYQAVAGSQMLQPLGLEDRRHGRFQFISAVPVGFFAANGDLETFSTPILYRDLTCDPRLSEERHDYSRRHGLKGGVDAPILLDGRVIAVMCVRSGEARDWSQDELMFVTSLANLASLIFERHERKKAEARIAESRNTLIEQQSEIHDIMRSPTLRNTQRDEVFRELSRRFSTLLRVESAALWLFNADKTAFEYGAVYDAAKGAHVAQDIGAPTEFVAAVVAHTMAGDVAVSDCSSYTSSSRIADVVWSPLAIKSALYAPIIIDGAVVGVITGSSIRAPRVWTVEETQFASGIANLAALAIERQDRVAAETRESARAARLARSQAVLNDLMMHESFRAGDFQQMAQVFATAVGEELAADRVGIRLIREDAEEARLSGVYLVATKAFHLSESLPRSAYPEALAAALAKGEMIVADCATDPITAPYYDVQFKPFGIRAALLAPFFANGAIAGYMIVAMQHRTRLWTAEDAMLAVGAANLVTLALERLARLRIERDLRTANEAADAANRAKSRFLANMSHEIRTPMNGVFGMTDLLMRTEMTERQRRLVGTISQSAKTLLTIINDILDISRIEEGKLNLDRHEFDLERCVEDAVELLADEAQRKKLDLNLFVDGRIAGNVQGDSGRLRQVLVNLIGNAIKFTPSGEVCVRLCPETGGDDLPGAMLEVRDTGIGIEPDILDKLFQPFTQADSSISRRFGGTGLGLAISRHIVELMGGSMQIESAPGKGTRILVWLPLEPYCALDACTPRAEQKLNGRHVLVIDDRDTNREIITTYLESAGAVAAACADGQGALDLLQAASDQGRPYDLAIIDLIMPGLDGLEVGRRIKATPAIADTRTILLSSMSWTGDVPTVREAGIDRLLHKPIRREELIGVVWDVLKDCPQSMAVVSQGPDCASARQSIPSGPSAAPSMIAASSNRALGLRVLLAEDNPVNQIVASEYLQSLGCLVTSVENGREALEALEKDYFDVVLMDCQMPEMDGLSAARAIRDRERSTGGRSTPIIAVTANAYEEDRQKSLAAGMDGYLSKPISEAELERALRQWCKQPFGSTASALAS